MSYAHTVILPTATERPLLDQGLLTFVGTATVLLRYAGFTVLTDPNFLHRGDHVHLGYGLKSRRLTNPAFEMKDLHPFDILVLSHLHEDHFDRLVERRLDKGTMIATTSQAAESLRKKNFYRAYGLDTWQVLNLTKGNNSLSITALPGRHGPGPVASLLPAVMGSLLEFRADDGKKTLRVYISGDTLMYKDLREIPKRFPDIDLALLHLGGTKILGLMVTMNGKQGLQLVKLINPHEFIPIHYNDYDVFKSSLEEFQKAVDEACLSKRARYLNHGDAYTFPVPIVSR